VLENALVRLVSNRETGQFALWFTGRDHGLFQAGPALMINDREVTAREAVKVTTRHESFADKTGQGEILIVEYQFSVETPSFRYQLSLYRDTPWISVTAYLPKGDYRLGDSSLVQGETAGAGGHLQLEFARETTPWWIEFERASEEYCVLAVRIWTDRDVERIRKYSFVD
jgi:hypothetical protein